MEIKSFDSSSDIENKNNDTSINLFFKRNTLTMHHSDGNFDEEEDDDFKNLPVYTTFTVNKENKVGISATYLA